MNEKTVTITEAEYNQLLKDSEWLSCLEEAGVDNWEGYDEAFHIRRERQLSLKYKPHKT